MDDNDNLNLIKQIFNKIDNKSDLFYYIQENNIKLKNNYIIYKNNIDHNLKIEIRNYRGISKFIININLNKKLITSFYYKDFIGLFEKIYVNKIEYYINEVFYSFNIDKNLEEIMQFITKLIFQDKLSKDLYDFIISDEDISLISKKNINKLNIFSD